MRYTQKDVCRAFDIKRDTLRHYERLGIIHPHIDERNGYRYYDDWQINLLWECKRYQAMGFSLSQVCNILHHGTLRGLQTHVEDRLEQMERELAYQAMALDSMRLYRSLLQDMSERLGTFYEQAMPRILFVPRREIHDLLLDDGSRDAGTFVNQNQAVCLPPTAYFPRSDRERYFWGFAMLGERYEMLHGPTEGAVVLEASRVLSTCVDAGERWNFGAHLFDGLRTEAKRRNEVPVGPLYGFLLARTFDESGNYHHYVEAYLPVQG